MSPWPKFPASDESHWKTDTATDYLNNGIRRFDTETERDGQQFEIKVQEEYHWFSQNLWSDVAWFLQRASKVKLNQS